MRRRMRLKVCFFPYYCSVFIRSLMQISLRKFNPERKKNRNLK